MSLMNEFFAMGGYAFYVWMAYGVTAIALAVEVAMLRARRRRVLLEARIAEPDASITTRSALDPGSLA
jgi:heme exporter protein D